MCANKLTDSIRHKKKKNQKTMPNFPERLLTTTPDNDKKANLIGRAGINNTCATLLLAEKMRKNPVNRSCGKVLAVEKKAEETRYCDGWEISAWWLHCCRALFFYPSPFFLRPCYRLAWCNENLCQDFAGMRYFGVSSELFFRTVRKWLYLLVKSK